MLEGGGGQRWKRGCCMCFWSNDATHHVWFLSCGVMCTFNNIPPAGITKSSQLSSNRPGKRCDPSEQMTWTIYHKSQNHTLLGHSPLPARQAAMLGQPSSLLSHWVKAGGKYIVGMEREACKANATAQAGMMALLFCCLARQDSDLGVRKRRSRRDRTGGGGGVVEVKAGMRYVLWVMKRLAICDFHHIIVFCTFNNLPAAAGITRSSQTVKITAPS